MLAAWTVPLALLASPGPGEPAPGGPPGETEEKLSAALRLKEERRLEEARLQLEALVGASGRSGPEPPGGAAHPAGGGPFSALTVLAEIEAVDVRMRLGRLEGVDARLRKLREAWAGNAEVRKRVRALEGLYPLRGGLLLEPNAISRADLGDRFRQKFPPRNREESQQVPLNHPLRYLSDLSPGFGSRNQVLQSMA